DIDTIYLSGYGFPAYRGGPMWYADTVGLDKILSRILAFREKHGEAWEPAPLLKRLVEESHTFARLDAGRALCVIGSDFVHRIAIENQELVIDQTGFRISD